MRGGGTLDRLDARYGLLGPVADAIHGSRVDRQGLERKVALMLIDMTGKDRSIPDISLFGSFSSLPKVGDYSWIDYMRDKASGALADRAAIKIFNKRRGL